MIIDTESKVCESLFIEIDGKSVGSNKNIIVGVIYRPPDRSIKEFIDKLRIRLDCIKQEKKLLYLTGDYNINLLNYDTHKDTKEFLDLMFSNSFIPLIDKPTRVKTTAIKKTATLIDNIFTNNLIDHLDSHQGIFFTDISDHFPIFHIKKYIKKCNDSTRPIFKRKFNDASKKSFTDKLQDVNWELIKLHTNSQIAFTVFHKMFFEIYDACFPLQMSHIRYNSSKPWLTSGLRATIKQKNKLFLHSKKYPEDEIIRKYVKCRNKLNHLLRIVEKQYYQELIETNKSNLGKTWKIIKQIINKHSGKQCITNFLHNNTTINEGQAISDLFNDYFTNVGPNLAKNIPASRNSPQDYLKGSFPQSIYLKPVTEKEICLIIKDLKNSASGWDDISALALKQSAPFISDILVYLCNLSLTSGTVPTELKLAIVTPIFKANDPKLVSNYRPVSVLPMFSKMYERIIYNRLIDYLNKYDILCKKSIWF